MTSRRRTPIAPVDEPVSRRRIAISAGLLCPLLLAGCGSTSTTVLRADGWRYSGPIEASDGDSVTLTGPEGPVVIPRREVIDYDLPGNGWALAGGIVFVSGLNDLVDVARRVRPQTASDYAGPGVTIALGAALGGLGLWWWLDARGAWAGTGGGTASDQVVWTGDGVLVRF